VLIVAFESADHAMDARLTRALELVRDHGGEIADTRQIGAWKQAFFDAPYLQSALLSIGILCDTFETCCTWAAFPELHAQVTQAVRLACRGIVSCRFTHVYPDGPAPYYTFLCDGADPGTWCEVKRAASDAVHAAGGTITHHHAVGRTHRPWYDRERPALVGHALAAVKRAWDPRGIMNPGVLID
jgi:alkyldihydroxyacetonephosphate synthase